MPWRERLCLVRPSDNKGKRRKGDPEWGDPLWWHHQAGVLQSGADRWRGSCSLFETTSLHRQLGGGGGGGGVPLLLPGTVRDHPRVPAHPFRQLQWYGPASLQQSTCWVMRGHESERTERVTEEAQSQKVQSLRGYWSTLDVWTEMWTICGFLNWRKRKYFILSFVFWEEWSKDSEGAGKEDVSTEFDRWCRDVNMIWSILEIELYKSNMDSNKMVIWKSHVQDYIIAGKKECFLNNYFFN